MQRKCVSKFIIPEVYGDALSYEEQVLQLQSGMKEVKEIVNETVEKVETIEDNIVAIENNYLNKQTGGFVSGTTGFENLYVSTNDNGGGQLTVGETEPITVLGHRNANDDTAAITMSNIGENDRPVIRIEADGGVQVRDVVTPTADNHAANKKYVDSAISTNNSEVVIPQINSVRETAENALPKSGGTMTGNIGFGTGLSMNPPANTSVFNGIEVVGNVRLNTGTLYMNGKKVSDVGAPSADTDAANKKYVDEQIATIDTDNFVEKTEQINRVYGTNPDGTPKLWGVGDISVNYLVNRTANGNILLPNSNLITNDNYAASKKYVDDTVTASMAGVASIGGATGAISLANGLAIIQNALQINKYHISIDIVTESTSQIVNGAWRYGNIIVFHGKTVQPFVVEGGTDISSPDEDFTYAQFGVIVCGGQVGTLIPARETFEFSSVASGNFFGFILM